MRINVDTAKLALRLLVEGNSIRSTERITKLHRDTICRLVVMFGTRCKRFLDERMRNLTLTHLQFDEQWTYVYKKQSRLTVDERATSHDRGDVYLWTCVDQQTKLMPGFLIGKRSADNARRFLTDISNRLSRPAPHTSDAHAFERGGYRAIIQISTDGWAGYPEAVDLAFGPYAKFGTIIKEYRNATMIYTPSEMVGTRRTGMRVIEEREIYSICTSHVERLNGTQRLFHETAEPSHVLLLKEAGELGGGLRHVRGYLQLLLADAEARQVWPEATHGGYDGKIDRAHLGL